MSVLIKNMKMPSRCFDCTFSKWSNLHQTKACNCGSNYFKPCFEDNSEEFYTKRADFCPLVEVPAPHGDLIDRDALNIGEYEREDDDSGALEISIGGLLSLYHGVIDAPPIIKAEVTE